MTTLRLGGCRSDTLLGYLKAVGVLRIVGTQADATARGSWDGQVFALTTRLPQEELLDFLLRVYAPSPIFNPWNNGAGFDGKANSAADESLNKIRQSNGARWKSYKEVLEFLDGCSLTRERRAGDKKAELIRELRLKCPDSFLPWLDAAALLTAEGVAYSYFFGAGGNDGHLDFAVNFAARALDVCGDTPIQEAQNLLSDSLFDSSSGQLLAGKAIGQFSPRHAGGPNADTGYQTESLVNPWDFVFMMEGGLLFSGSIARRGEKGVGAPSFPFALRGVPSGYGSASPEEESRGELWLPVWNGSAALCSIRDMLRRGRIDLPGDETRPSVRSASDASEAAAAVVTLGVGLGLGRLERITFVKRRGDNYAAAMVGSVMVSGRFDAGIAVISRSLASWIDRVRGKSPGASSREAIRAFDEGLLAFSILPLDAAARARARQGLLVAVADLDRALARLSDDGKIGEAPGLPASLLEDLDDGSVSHRAAAAVASLGSWRVVSETRDELRIAGDDAVETLRALVESRIRKKDGDWLRASCFISASDAATFLEFDAVERRRFGRLLRAYALLRLGTARLELAGPDGVRPARIPAAYAVLKLVFNDPKARDERILRRLFAGNAQAALQLAMQRARTIQGLPHAPRDIALVRVGDPRWYAAALALPINLAESGWPFFNAALVSRIQSGEENALLRSYVASI